MGLPTVRTRILWASTKHAQQCHKRQHKYPYSHYLSEIPLDLRHGFMPQTRPYGKAQQGTRSCRLKPTPTKQPKMSISQKDAPGSLGVYKDYPCRGLCDVDCKSILFFTGFYGGCLEKLLNEQCFRADASWLAGHGAL